MKKITRSICRLTICIAAFILVSLAISCTKNPITPPPVHDTVVVIKTDTTIKTDTIPYVDPAINSLKNGLVLYLPLNGTMVDSSGYGNTVTAVNGGGLTYDMHGHPNCAFGGNGTGGRLIVSNNGAYKVDSAFSISFDFEINVSNGSTVTFLSLVNPTTGNGPTFNLGLNEPTHPYNFYFGDNAAMGSDCSSSGLANGANSVHDITSFTPLINNWYNAVCVFKNGADQVYINGNLVDSATKVVSPALFCTDANFIVGGWWNSDPQSINGRLDEVRFYNRVLTPHEITYLARNFQVNSTKQNPGLKAGKGVVFN